MNKSSLQRMPRNVWVVTATSFLTDVSSEMLTNLIPFFLANVLGVRTAVIGLIDGIAETTASLLKLDTSGIPPSETNARRFPSLRSATTPAVFCGVL